jgi:N-acetylmuramoyl-L-alanine amidase
MGGRLSTQIDLNKLCWLWHDDNASNKNCRHIITMSDAALLNPKNIRFLVVHCSDTDDDSPIDATDIHSMHLGFGWDGIGYHKVITRNGEIQTGRPEYWRGAHVYQHNHESLGVCLIGRSTFTDEQMAALEGVLKDWAARYPGAEICGHCDFDNTEKTCPNFDAAAFAKSRKIV